MSTTRKEHRYYLGKCDADGNGRNVNEAYITWSYDGTTFSMCAEVWQANKRDIIRGGQCVDTVAAFFPHNKKAQRMVEIWKRWHLNDLTAGSPAQEAWLREHRDEFPGYPVSHYTWVAEQLAAAGLNPDPNYLYKGQPYKYGHAWLKEELPAEVRAEIESWDTPNDDE